MTTDAFGFVTASPDTRYDETIRELRRQLSLPLVGGTSLGNPFDISGGDFGTSVAVVGKKNMKHATVLSDPVKDGDAGSAGWVADDLHRRAVEELGCGPKLFIVFMPITTNLFADHLIEALYKAAGSVPVFGGMVSDDFNSDRSSVFFNGECFDDRIVLVALGGDIDPVFAVGQEMTSPSGYSPVITEAEGNVIHRVDGMTFVEFLGKYDIDASAIEDFPIGLRMRNPKKSGGKMPRVSDVVKIEGGSGVFANTVNAGDTVSLCYATQENIGNSARDCVGRLKAAMAEKEAAGARFDVILAASCVARYFIIARGSRNVEADALAEALPDGGGIAKFGMFAFGEYCPVPDDAGGLVNTCHSQTLAMCAF